MNMPFCVSCNVKECMRDNCLPVSERVTNDSRWRISKSVITHSSPVTAIEHLNTSFVWTWTTNQSYWKTTIRLIVGQNFTMHCRYRSSLMQLCIELSAYVCTVAHNILIHRTPCHYKNDVNTENCFQNGGRPPSWILENCSFGHVTDIGMWFFISFPNFASIGQ